jgi:hypothetical protein
MDWQLDDRSPSQDIALLKQFLIVMLDPERKLFRTPCLQ